jgi:hypothetical protein
MDLCVGWVLQEVPMQLTLVEVRLDKYYVVPTSVNGFAYAAVIRGSAVPIRRDQTRTK